MSSTETFTLPGAFNAPFITQVFFPRCFKRGCYDCVNYGKCYDWAFYAYCLFSEVQLWTNWSHAWVEVDGKFYDSRYHMGVTREEATDVRFNRNDNRMVSVQELKEFWNEHGGGRRDHWDLMLQEIRDKGLSPIRDYRGACAMDKTEKVPSKVMDKETMTKELTEQLSVLKDHAESLGKLLEDLNLIVRPTGDVLFSALDKSKAVLDSMTEVRTSVQKVRTTLKARAMARMKEG